MRLPLHPELPVGSSRSFRPTWCIGRQSSLSHLLSVLISSLLLQFSLLKRMTRRRGKGRQPAAVGSECQKTTSSTATPALTDDKPSRPGGSSSTRVRYTRTARLDLQPGLTVHLSALHVRFNDVNPFTSSILYAQMSKASQTKPATVVSTNFQ